MERTVCFRDFEERDIDFIYKCKNDEKLNSMIVGQWHPFTYEEAVKWVHGCMGEHETYKFWAIATNDEEKRIVGWTALADIDNVNKSASTYSLVIGDPDYNDGFAWIEAGYFLLEYAFDVLHLHRLYGVSLVGHNMSNKVADLFFYQVEGILRQAAYKNDRYYDLQYIGILEDEFYSHKKGGDYDIRKIIKRLRSIKNSKK